MSGSDYCREALPLEWLATWFSLCLGVSTFLWFYSAKMPFEPFGLFESV